MSAQATRLSENTLLQKLGHVFSRTPLQINDLLESDAELIRSPGGGILAITTDCIVEEISSGLYHDPTHIGWMTVAVNLSDIAAVGAQPLGIVLSENLPPHFPEEKLIELQRGIADACQAMGVHVLGGDTNHSNEWQMGATALGFIPEGEPVIMRKGASIGDRLFASGPMGLGSAYSYDQLFDHGQKQVAFFPRPRLEEGKLVRFFGSCCIDTSDGFFHALSNLSEINHLRFHVDFPLPDLLHPLALDIATEHHLPPWIFLAGPHGEFELLFTVPEERCATFLQKAADRHWYPLHLGQCTDQPSSTFLDPRGLPVELDTFAIANAWDACQGDPSIYFAYLLQMNAL